MFQQSCDIVLHGGELVELKVGIKNRKQIAGEPLFVNKNALAVSDQLFFDLKQTFALKHGRKDVAGRDVLWIVQFDNLAQERFGRFLLDGLRRRRWSFINTTPVGDKPLAIARAITELFLPARLANIEAPKRGFLVKQQGVIMFLVVKSPAARSASVSP